MHRLLMHSWNIFQRYRQRISEYYDSNFHYRFFHDPSEYFTYYIQHPIRVQVRINDNKIHDVYIENDR